MQVGFNYRSAVIVTDGGEQARGDAEPGEAVGDVGGRASGMFTGAFRG